MPGISAECSSGNCAACTMGLECRCRHHEHTQQLMRKSPASRPRALEIVPEQPQLENTCPTCGEKAKSTDIFCRKDGAKLMLGKQCLACGSPGDSTDVHCWQCGWKHGEKPPEPTVDEQPKEDPLVTLKKKAVELGLLRETVV